MEVIPLNKRLKTSLASLQNHPPQIIGEGEWKNYAILLPLIPDGKGEFSLLFEVRASHLKTQPGEISFPGGAIEDGESPVEAAIRETGEELLLSPHQVHILAHPYTYVSTYGRKIDCFLGLLEGYGETFSTDEVDQIFTIPLEALAHLEAKIYRSRVREFPEESFPYEDIPGGRNYHFIEGESITPFFYWAGKTIWGLTGRILRQLQKDLSM